MQCQQVRNAKDLAWNSCQLACAWRPIQMLCIKIIVTIWEAYHPCCIAEDTAIMSLSRQLTRVPYLAASHTNPYDHGAQIEIESVWILVFNKVNI